MLFRRRWLDDAATVIGQDRLTPQGISPTAASLAVGAGANVKAVQRMLGYASSAAATLEVETGLLDGYIEAVSEPLD